MKIQINKIKPDPNQPRKTFDPVHIKGLAKNLKIEGMINPIEVDSDYMIITGECRWRSAKEAGWKEVPINVNKGKLSKYERIRRQMAENLHQSAAGGSSPMNAVDVAKGYKRMLGMMGFKWYAAYHKASDKGIRKLGRELAVSHKKILTYLNLFEEPSYVLESIEKKKTKFSSFEEVRRVPEKYKEGLKKAIVEGKIKGHRDIRRFANLAKSKPEKAEIEFLRITKQQDHAANKILNRAIELSLALKDCDASKFSSQDKGMIRSQLSSTRQSIAAFFNKLK